MSPEPEPSERPSVEYRFRRMLDAGDWIVSVEVDPPAGVSARRGLEAAAALRAAGVDCIDVGDSPMASVRMSALAFAASAQQQSGVEAIIHYAARDRNLMALQSDLLGAHMQGIRSVIALSGDPPSLGRYANATAVWDVKAEGLIELITTLNGGVDSAGNDLHGRTEFTIAAAANPTNPDPAAELARMHEKAARGAHVFMTQPAFEPEVVHRFLDTAAAVGRPIILGVLPLVSGRNARYMATNVPGISVPAAIVERMEAAGEGAAEVGVEIARGFIDAVRAECAGVYLIPSLGRFGGAIQLVRELRGTK